MTFVFCHLGENPTFATIFVRSLRLHMPKATILQCSDADAAQIDGVNEVHRLQGDSSLRMMFRMECFARMDVGPAMYLDTDMICTAPIDPVEVLGDHDVAVCQRSYNHKMYVRPRGYGVEINLPEYRDRTYGDVYPYVGCATITKDGAFWSDCYERMLNMEPKFWGWFGDQEAIRDAVNGGAYKVKMLPESKYACLIDREKDPDPAIVHFKGKDRKFVMLDIASKLGLLTQQEKAECLS